MLTIERRRDKDGSPFCFVWVEGVERVLDYAYIVRQDTAMPPRWRNGRRFEPDAEELARVVKDTAGRAP